MHQFYDKMLLGEGKGEMIMNEKKNIMVTTLPDGTKEEVEVLLAFKFNFSSNL